MSDMRPAGIYAYDRAENMQLGVMEPPPPQPRFCLIEPGELRHAWAFVRPALDTLDRPDGWLPEDVYLLLRSNGATLYLIYDKTGSPAGFFILRLIQDFDGARVHIWILHAVDADFDVMAEFDDELQQLARRAGAVRLTFSTNRPGWHKVAPKYGFSPREITYEKPVSARGPS
jgi:hypothetical protein